MSDLGIEHPLPLIENLLKERKGDEGRLLYIRNALKNGKNIYQSDKEYLSIMKQKYSKTSPSQYIPNKNHKNVSTESISTTILEDKPINSAKKILKNTNKTSNKQFESELETIQNSLEDLKTKKSKITDNLNLVSINREILSQTDLEISIQFNSFSNLPKNTSSDLFELIKDSPRKKVKNFGMKKYDLMAYASAGFFSLWFASYQNLIDLGALQGLPLGFAAGAAASAGIFYGKRKIKISNIL